MKMVVSVRLRRPKQIAPSFGIHIAEQRSDTLTATPAARLATTCTGADAGLVPSEPR